MILKPKLPSCPTPTHSSLKCLIQYAYLTHLPTIQYLIQIPHFPTTPYLTQTPPIPNPTHLLTIPYLTQIPPILNPTYSSPNISYLVQIPYHTLFSTVTYVAQIPPIPCPSQCPIISYQVQIPPIIPHLAPNYSTAHSNPTFPIPHSSSNYYSIPDSNTAYPMYILHISLLFNTPLISPLFRQLLDFSIPHSCPPIPYPTFFKLKNLRRFGLFIVGHT
jgi:hypothetical protein